MGIPREDMLLL